MMSKRDVGGAIRDSTMGDDYIPERRDRKKKARKIMPKADPERCDEAGERTE
jgi:hypothetical protein